MTGFVEESTIFVIWQPQGNRITKSNSTRCARKVFSLYYSNANFWPFFTIFVPYWTSNCYVIIEYTENLIKPSYSSLKTVLDRVPALVPKFKIDQNMLFLISSRAFRPTRGIVIQMSVCMAYGVTKFVPRQNLRTDVAINIILFLTGGYE